ncbi:sensor histidine kinase [Olivibacter sitiensis]|uniref:sensor histidine kinase n=1 Tax=Olivibacter sitiensis TaxID=376470 RepID=UPI00040F3992|nr:histidine kinase [Olivibacter sitiensis]
MKGTLPFFVLVLGVLLFVALALLIFLWRQFSQLKHDKQHLQAKYKELEQKTTGLDADQLRYKLNPHLFRNALNAIQSHAYQSYYALDKLSNVLDYILYDSDNRMVSLAEEINFAKSLVEINKLKTSPLFDIRFKNKIREDETIYHEMMIAPFSCANPIENAFKHADIQSDDAFISIVFSIEDDNWFQLYVANKIPRGKKEQKNKGGLGNVMFKNRLKAIYGIDGFSLIETINNEVYISQLKIKLDKP